MSIPLYSDPLVMSPMSRVPYDVLQEIFIHCLPRYRLRVRQPNPMTAPMLLCHICSSWRTVALGSPTLWSHLSYRLAVADANHDLDSDNHNWRFLKHQLAFLSWWRRNQGIAPPSICLKMTGRRDKPLEVEPDAAKTRSLFQYIASARYLEVEEFFWCILREWNEGEGQDVYPSPWLGLDHPACPIRKITLIDSAAQGAEWGHGVKDDVLSRFAEHAKEARSRNVVFDIVLDTDTQPAAGAWNEWGPNLVHRWV